MLVNCRSLKNKEHQIDELIISESPDIIAFTETWLDNDMNSGEFLPPEYVSYRRDRNCHGGGVMLAIHKRIPSYELNFENDTHEVCWCCVKLGNVSVGVAAAYRPEEDQGIFPSLQSQVMKLKDQTKFVIIAGDFNTRDFNWSLCCKGGNGNVSSTMESDIQNFVDSTALEQLVFFPTRITADTSSTLDLVFSNLLAETNIYPLPGISDHQVVCASFGLPGSSPCTFPLAKRYIFSQTNINNVNAKLEERYIQFKQKKMSVDDMLNTYMKDLHEVLEEEAPKKNLHVKNKPWHDRQVKRLVNQKKRRRKAYRRHGNDELLLEIKSLSRSVVNKMKSNKDLYIKEICNNFKQQPRKFWNYIRLYCATELSIPTLQNRDKAEITNAYQKANTLNKTFEDNFTVHSGENVPAMQNRLPNGNAFTMSRVTVGGVMKLIDDLKTNSAPGPDGLHPSTLKFTRDLSSKYLADIFNASLDTGVVPQSWKEAIVVPIFKQGSKNIPGNYRPISLTSILSKLLEHIIASQMMKFLIANNLLSDRQFGFRAKSSTELMLISMVHKISNNIQGGGQVDIIGIDFQKAFDRVSHEHLLSKLAGYGLNIVIPWFRSFLLGRTQRVKVDGELSDCVFVKSGVPQGSVIGPILFSIYINDILDDLECDPYLYADDNYLVRQIFDIRDCHALQRDLNRLNSWCNDWAMVAQPDKSVCLTVTRSTAPILHNYVLSERSLTRVQSMKCLGITLQADLRWDEHIKCVTGKASNRLRFLMRVLRDFSAETKKVAYISMVRSLLEYAVSAWDPWGADQTRKLEMVQRRASRFITGRYNHDECVTDLLWNLGLQSLEERRKQHRLNLLYKIKHGKSILQADDYLLDPTFISKSDHSQKIRRWQCTTDFFRWSFFPRTIVEWNNLPSSVVEAPSVESFARLCEALYVKPTCDHSF